MVKKLLRNSSGKLLFEDPGKLYYTEISGSSCPDCSAGCQTKLP